MSQLNVNNLKQGITFESEGNLYVVISAQHSKQARSGAIVKTKVKDLRDGTIVIKTFTAGSKINKAHIEKKLANFLYSDSDFAYFIDTTTYEQIEVKRERFEREISLLKEGASLMIKLYQEELIDIELPLTVELKVTYSPPAVRGNSTSTPQKRVKLETGFELEVPIFIVEGDIITVNTLEGKYVSRQNKTGRF